MDDYWDNYSEYDAAVEEMKEALRNSVSDEITKRIETLTTENRDLKGRLEGLDRLELEAAQSKAKYDREYESAKREAVRDARKGSLVALLQALDERLYAVEPKPVMREKCTRCNDRRQLPYTTPRGKVAADACECASTDYRWEATEVAAHEVVRREGKLLIWWLAVKTWGEDGLGHRVLKSSEGVPVAMLAENPRDYSYKDRASAQAVADAANTKEN